MVAFSAVADVNNDTKPEMKIELNTWTLVAGILGIGLFLFKDRIIDYVTDRD